jgi:uncharacterized protein (DUF362 family)
MDKKDMQKAPPIVMASSAIGENLRVRITDEELSTLNALVRVEESTKMSLANIYLDLKKVSAHALDAHAARDGFCVELKNKYGLDAKFGKKSWHVEWEKKEIVAD